MHFFRYFFLGPRIRHIFSLGVARNVFWEDRSRFIHIIVKKKKQQTSRKCSTCLITHKTGTLYQKQIR